jgi:hypothetical protein
MGVAVLVALASAGILSGILDAITGLIAQYGYPAVFAAAFLEVIFPPIPSEVIFPLVRCTWIDCRGGSDLFCICGSGKNGNRTLWQTSYDKRARDRKGREVV